MYVKTDKERRDFVLQFRLNRGERRQLELLSKSTGQSFSNIFRLRVLGGLRPMIELNEEVASAIGEQQAILAMDVGDKKKGQLLQQAFVQRIAKKRIAHEMGQKRKKAV